MSSLTSTTYGAEYDQIVQTIQMYIDGCKQGNSALMRPAFHPSATFFGYAGPELAVGTPFLFDWVDHNGPSPNIRPRFISVDIAESIAAVRLEVDGWSGRLAGPDVCMSDIFTLLKTSEGWTIVLKAFHAYRFTVDDHESFTRPFTPESRLVRADDSMFEYACHEANYSMTAILRGGRAADKR